MTMTISDFLNLPNFSDLNLLAGKNGLDRELTNVTVVDTPDGTNWLNGGEFVITTAMKRRISWNFCRFFMKNRQQVWGLKKTGTSPRSRRQL